MNIFAVFLTSSFLVKLILLILISFSIISWAIIIQQTYVINTVSREANVFESKFWLTGLNLSRLYQESQERRDQLSSLEKIFYSGFKEFTKLYSAKNQFPAEVVEGVARVMRISINCEIAALEKNISCLGNIGSISPYVGLFGTVWGIINAFNNLGTVKLVNLQTIAPNIAEALIATAISLFVTIPAVMTFNLFSYRVHQIEKRFDNFTEEVLTLLYRQAFIKNST